MTNGPGFYGEGPGNRQREDAGGAPGGDDTFADVLNGFTLDSGRRRRKRKKDRDPDPPTPAPADGDGADRMAPEATAADTDWAAASGALASGAYAAAEPAGQGSSLFDPGSGGPESGRPPAPDFDGASSAVEETAAVRPYAITGGRTKANANYSLELETLISTSEKAAMTRPEWVANSVEYRSIVAECSAPKSVAEIASSLRVPLGVARVLVSDVADAGLVTVHKTITSDDGAEAHLELMERVLSGLRRL